VNILLIVVSTGKVIADYIIYEKNKCSLSFHLLRGFLIAYPCFQIHQTVQLTALSSLVILISYWNTSIIRFI